MCIDTADNKCEFYQTHCAVRKQKPSLRNAKNTCLPFQRQCVKHRATLELLMMMN